MQNGKTDEQVARIAKLLAGCGTSLCMTSGPEMLLKMASGEVIQVDSKVWDWIEPLLAELAILRNKGKK